MASNPAFVAPPPSALISTDDEPHPGGLRASYFTNQELRGKPAFTRTEGPLNLAWTAEQGPPDGLRAPLSIRWEGFLIPPSTGSYTLITTGDDGVRLSLDGKQLIDNWTIRYATEDRATVKLEAGQAYPLVIEFFDRGYDGLFRFEWDSDTLDRQLVPARALASGTPPPPMPAGEPGLQATYFDNQELQGEPAFTRIDRVVDLRWERDNGPGEKLRAPLSVRWQGTLVPPADGRYRLFVTGDDGVRFWLGGKQWIDAWVVRAISEDRIEVDLKGGRPYPLVLEFFDRGYTGVIRLEWQSDALARAVVPQSALIAGKAAPSGATQTLEFTPLAPEDGERVNPLRGFYRWFNEENVPSPGPRPEPSLDSYARYEWSALEPERGRYDFAVIERDLQRAAERGVRHGFRIRALVANEQQSVPDYLIPLMERGWRHDYRGDGKLVYVPDWNDTDFLDRAEKLLRALGERYNDDPRISFLDIGLFGVWGEWHMYNFPYRSPSGAVNMTRANRQRLIDMYLAAFPAKHLVMMTDDEQSLIYALRQSPRVGWRRDSLGDEHFDTVLRDLNSLGDADVALFAERWKTAPAITEFITPNRQQLPTSYHAAYEQVRRYHVSMVGNGNTRDWKRLDAEERNALVAIGQVSGYHYALETVRLPTSAPPGGALAIESRWVNLGVAPTYDDWEVVWQLRDRAGKLVWEQPSALALRELLPDDGPPLGDGRSASAASAAVADPPIHTQVDTLTLATTLSPGTYELFLLIRDPQNYLRPMQLAIDLDQQDGAYPIGELTIKK